MIDGSIFAMINTRKIMLDRCLGTFVLVHSCKFNSLKGFIFSFHSYDRL